MNYILVFLDKCGEQAGPSLGIWKSERENDIIGATFNALSTYFIFAKFPFLQLPPKSEGPSALTRAFGGEGLFQSKSRKMIM